MKCETCNVRNFVHDDLYCQDCKDKPKPKIKTGRAYLFREAAFTPVTSVEIEAPKGMEYEVAAVELMQGFRIEFIEADSEELTKTLLKEMGK